MRANQIDLNLKDPTLSYQWGTAIEYRIVESHGAHRSEPTVVVRTKMKAMQTKTQLDF